MTHKVSKCLAVFSFWPVSVYNATVHFGPNLDSVLVTQNMIALVIASYPLAIKTYDYQTPKPKELGEQNILRNLGLCSLSPTNLMVLFFSCNIINKSPKYFDVQV